MKRSLVALTAVVAMIPGVGGCDRPAPGPVQPGGAIPFNLIIPNNTPRGSYNAISGLLLTTELIPVGIDSVEERTGQGYYAEFLANGAPLPERVTLNGSRLDRHLDTDTLRLRSATSDAYGKNVWALYNSATDSVLFDSNILTPVTGVTPFADKAVIRSDTNLVLKWTPPQTPSGGMVIVWTIAGATTPDFYVETNDAIGSYIIPRQTMEKLRGPGQVSFIRYRNEQRSHNGRSFWVTRLSQHTYNVEVQL